MSKRISSIDFFRGLAIGWMIFGHSMEWMIQPAEYDYVLFINILFDWIGAAGFLFVSGMSITLSYQRKIIRTESISSYNYRHLRLEYFLRAIFLLIVSFIYNGFGVIFYGKITIIWQWFILQTIPISLMLIWPLLKYSKLTKIIAAAAFLIFDQILIILLSPFENHFSNPLGIIHYILYSGDQLSPILGFFPFFIMGSIMGDIIYEHYMDKDIEIPNSKFLKTISFPIISAGISLILIAIFLIPPGPMAKYSLSWLIYSIGVQLTFFSILLIIEKLNIINIDKKYRFFFYFSYYSFTIFLLHYPIYFLFTQKLTVLQFFIIIPIIIFLIGQLLKIIYYRVGALFSLKYQLGRLGREFALRIERWQSKGKTEKLKLFQELKVRFMHLFE